MSEMMDFPANPELGQYYVNSINLLYQWDGQGWIVVKAPDPIDSGYSLADLLEQIRILLQDTDNSSEFRYSTHSLILNINQSLLEMFRLRPDIFFPLDFKVPRFKDDDLLVDLRIEQQYVPPII